MTNKHNTTLYTGVTGILKKRIYEHKQKMIDSFTKRYNITKLVYYEVYDDPTNAIKREKQIKGGSRRKKVDLIENINPKWDDLYDNI
jgi:putative endonuclease